LNWGSNLEKKEKYERIIIKRGNHPLGRNHHFRPKTPARSAHPLCFARPDQPLPPRAHRMRVQPVSLKVVSHADCLSPRLGPPGQNLLPQLRNGRPISPLLGAIFLLTTSGDSSTDWASGRSLSRTQDGSTPHPPPLRAPRRADPMTTRAPHRECRHGCCTRLPTISRLSCPSQLDKGIYARFPALSSSQERNRRTTQATAADNFGTCRKPPSPPHRIDLDPWLRVKSRRLWELSHHQDKPRVAPGTRNCSPVLCHCRHATSCEGVAAEPISASGMFRITFVEHPGSCSFTRLGNCAGVLRQWRRRARGQTAATPRRGS
jgi:hypothetical protein